MDKETNFYLTNTGVIIRKEKKSPVYTPSGSSLSRKQEKNEAQHQVSGKAPLTLHSKLTLPVEFHQIPIQHQGKKVAYLTVKKIHIQHQGKKVAYLTIKGYTLDQVQECQENPLNDNRTTQPTKEKREGCNYTKLRRRAKAFLDTEKNVFSATITTRTTDTEQAQKYLNSLFTYIRKHTEGQGWKYLWKREQCKSGTVHYHILSTLPIFHYITDHSFKNNQAQKEAASTKERKVRQSKEKVAKYYAKRTGEADKWNCSKEISQLNHTISIPVEVADQLAGELIASTEFYQIWKVRPSEWLTFQALIDKIYNTEGSQ